MQVRNQVKAQDKGWLIQECQIQQGRWWLTNYRILPTQAEIRRIAV
jgi:hypothetical protein